MPSERIGPYRLERPLGAGGMGEVFLAYDERLGRRVAIKQVRVEEGAGEAASRRRERFRREARAAAQLNHPAIVQIYDLLQQGGCDYIVMEYVEGKSLRELLDDGWLEPDAVVRLGREVAEALAEAHAKGIVHRDLKTENVLVTGQSHAKVLDFGLAKALGREAGELSLSVDGNVLGTCRAMSPEQASGHEVDHRSDLFSLGTLLYEATTGVSPFEAENPLATVRRVIAHHPESPSVLNLALPPGLADLILRLLEKDPAARPADALSVAAELQAIAGSGPVAAGSSSRPSSPRLELPATQRTPVAGYRVLRGPSTPLPPGAGTAPTQSPSRASFGAAGRRLWLPVVAVAAAAALAAAWWALRGPRAAVRVAVLPPQVAAGAPPEQARVAGDVQLAVERALTGLVGVAPLDPTQVAPLAGPAVQVAHAVAADEVVTTTITAVGSEWRIAMRRIDGRSGTLVAAQTFSAPMDDARVLADAVAAHVRRSYPAFAARAGALTLDVGARDYEEYLHLRRTVDDPPPEVDWEAVLASLGRVRAGSPRFLETYLLEARVARFLYAMRRRPEHLERAFELVKMAQQLAPADPRPLLREFDIALTTGDLDRAASVQQALERLAPGDVAVAVSAARLAERRGDAAGALERMAAALARQPSWHLLYELADMELRHGRVTDARGHLEEALRLAPGNVYVQGKLAELELQGGSVERAESLYLELAGQSPNAAQYWSNAGFAQLLLGRPQAAAESFRRAASIDPQNPVLALNLADAELLMNRREEAAALYRRVLELASAPASWQDHLRRAQALAHLGEARRAVQETQQALQLAGGAPAAFYGAALVYALVGDRSSALANAEEAIAGRISPTWFALPWFSPIAGDPEFQRALAASRATASRR